MFIIELTNYLGFYPNVMNIKNSYFNLENGDFENIKSEWGKVDFVVHAIAFSDRSELTGEY